jgi:hypothetical protein
MVQIGMADRNGGAMGKFILDTAPFRSNKTLALTVWITLAGQSEPLQATGGWLIAPTQN